MNKLFVKCLGVLFCSALLAVCLAACGSPAASVSGKYHTDNLGLTFSDFEFSGNNQVTLYCAGFKNATGTYQAEGNHYKVTITSQEQDSHYYGQVNEIKEECDIIVTPVNDSTINVEIKAKDSSKIYAGQLGAKEYKKV